MASMYSMLFVFVSTFVKGETRTENASCTGIQNQTERSALWCSASQIIKCQPLGTGLDDQQLFHSRLDVSVQNFGLAMKIDLCSDIVVISSSLMINLSIRISVTFELGLAQIAIANRNSDT